MSQPHFHHSLRLLRKRLGFTQAEVAFLVGCTHRFKISRYEKNLRTPHLTTAFAYQVIFQAAASSLFEKAFKKIESETSDRAKELLFNLNDQPATRRRNRKIDYLKRLIKD
jgi:transcriptional regulator with XRE-family HTH domain